MCCSPWPAVFSKTITGTWEVLVDGKLQHVVWYQNRIGTQVSYFTEQTFDLVVRELLQGGPLEDFQRPMVSNAIEKSEVLAEVDWRKKGNSPRDLNTVRKEARSTGNCLIIPLLGSWESIRLLNTFDTPNLLYDIDKALEIPRPRSLEAVPAGMAGSFGGFDGRVVFLQFDVYDIVIAENAQSIPKVLPQINVEKRPKVNDAVFGVMHNWYRSPVAVCCFKSNEQAEAKPIAFAFEPTDPERLVVYMLDGHDGNPPDPNARVTVDHTIFVGSHLTPKEHATEIHYQDAIPEHLSPYVLQHAMGLPLHEVMFNGDLVFDVAKVRQGFFEGARILPKFAPPRNMNDARTIRQYPYLNGNKSQYVPVQTRQG